MSQAGLTREEAAARLVQYGPNALPEKRPPSFAYIFATQFLNPLIYILIFAAAVSLFLSDISDAVFITIVLLVNGLIGAAQEYSAGRAAAALKKLEQPHALVIRSGAVEEIDASQVVPGDLVLLESGGGVPADVEIIESSDLQSDESLLTGESVPVSKQVGQTAYAGALVTRGRGRGIVSSTGMQTKIGVIAREIAKRKASEPPLLIRMRRFTRNIAWATAVAIGILVAIGLMRSMGVEELFMMSVGLAVAAIPEGLPIAISVALAIAMRRMAQANVIVRNMPAIESLGSCTLIATDKTGTLTMNELTVTDIMLPDDTALSCETGHDIGACRIHGDGVDANTRAARLLHAAMLANEGILEQRGASWHWQGDTVDVALLAAAHKGGLERKNVHERYPLLSRIPYEPDLKYAASFHQREDAVKIFVKGAPETLIQMCSSMDKDGESVPIDEAGLLKQKDLLTTQGLRVLAFAEGTIEKAANKTELGHGQLINLTFLGMAGMQDPVRPEVPEAISKCYSAGIKVVMITGDDPKTAMAIAREAGLRSDESHVVTGEDIHAAEQSGEEALDALTRHARIYARVEPTQKLAIVLSLSRNGHFVAVTGDGVNDAPALKHSHVGVAMGRSGTAVARESADIILTDDNFASIVAGIREGRVAYANIRKVIFMLISTGVAEVLLFMLAMIAGLPMPLLAVQLLWLNLVTNGIQDVALACEKAEGDELSYPPRSPKEPIFDRVMLRRILHSSLFMGIGGFAIFWILLDKGFSEFEARNMLLLLFVLFENFQVLNSRSEHHSIFRQRFFANPFLIISIIAAQLLHIAAMCLPGISEVLALEPVRFHEWIWMLLFSALIVLVMEIEKLWDDRRGRKLTV